MTGSPSTRLVVLRGNSGSGKTTTARTLRERLGRGTAWVEQDHLRRILLREHDVPSGVEQTVIGPGSALDETVERILTDLGVHPVSLEG
ncbi:putative ATPase [Kribbella aluminosa]|uniref:ATPase n=1 Tax=Kribbella aluminosa TaxID=416017 RepID=A0ABS4UE14_9ACTN|nr:hypothetical protein [Kribbella aluminosa]MBP2349881.1 putative ATPase [Kribbella aluminosa]